MVAEVVPVEAEGTDCSRGFDEGSEEASVSG